MSQDCCYVCFHFDYYYYLFVVFVDFVVVFVIENGEDNKKESGVGEASIWDIANKDNYGKQ